MENLSDAMYKSKQSRSRKMEVLAVGLPRTGTASMALALGSLGFRHCAHGMDLLDSLPYAARWEKAVDAKFYGKGKPFERTEFDELLGHCSAITDMPAAVFWRELYAAYPDVKIVLVQRNEDKWYRSFSEGVVEQLYSSKGRFNRVYIEPLLGSRIGEMSIKVLEGFFNARGPEDIRANAKLMYRKHYADVRAAIPPDRLLEYELGSGWEPLCRFLNRDIPDGDFPWVNEADALKKKVEEVQQKMVHDVRIKLFYRVFPVLGLILAVSIAWRSNLVSR